ncbi:MAG: hypothetical protein HWD59_08580 [Coxiellaceae bacterium]|nr:MAG: hypothetical protein HWD59_08580 [Coxiellaceae bacterium]
MARFWNTHNIHRLVLTNAIDFLTYFYLHAARLPLCLLQWATQTATFLFIAFQLNKIIAHTTIRYWLCLLFFAAFLFAPQMGLIWLWGYLIQQTMTPFFYILALFLLGYDDLKPRRDGIIATLAILCSLSSFNGLLIWPSIILLLLLGRAPWRAVMFYAALGAITMGVYAYHIGNLDQVVYSVTIFERLRYFLTFIGSMFSVQIINRGIKMGIIIVVVNLGLWLWFLFTKSLSLNQRRQLLPWLGMGIMTYGSAILGSIGRIENGLTQAMSDRYLPLSSPLWIGSLVVLLVLLYQVKTLYKNRRHFSHDVIVL